MHSQAKRTGTLFEQESDDVEPVFPHREVKRRAVAILTHHERTVFVDEPFNTLEVSCDAGTQEIPDIGARAG